MSKKAPVLLPAGESQAVTDGVPMDDWRYRRFGLLVLLVVFGGLGAWSALAPLEGAVVTLGQVKVKARSKVIQHLEGGIVTEIAVTSGDRVEPRQLLLRLSDVEPKAQLDIVRQQYFTSLALQARLKAERDDAAVIDFPPSLQTLLDDADIGPMIQGEQRLFAARRSARENEKVILNQRIEQLKKQILGLRALVESEKKRISSYKEELTEWEALFKEQLADKLRLLAIKREQAVLEGEQASNEARIAQLQIQIGETRAQMVLREQNLLSEIATQMRETQSSIADLKTRILALEDRLRRVEIRSPVAGTVVGLEIHTVGAVISPGQPLMEVLPLSDDFIIISRISPIDVDNVSVGQLADIRFSAFDASNTYVVEGRVANVSADALEDRTTGDAYYEAHIYVTAEGRRRMAGDAVVLQAGMPAETMIKTGERTLLNYLTKPFLDIAARAFRED